MRHFGTCRIAACLLCAAAAGGAMGAMATVAAPPLTALRIISIPVDAQMAASILAVPRKPGELRIAFMSNCFFQGAVRNGDRTAKLPIELTIVGRFENWVREQPGLRERPITVFNTSMDGTAILDHIAITRKLSEYGIDVLVIAMAYTEFRRLPVHPLLGNLRDILAQGGVDLADVDDLSKSRGRIISMDFQRWVTARKLDAYNAAPWTVNALLWNHHLRRWFDRPNPQTHYERLYGGEAIPVFHIGLKSRADQAYRPYLASLLSLAESLGIHGRTVPAASRMRTSHCGRHSPDEDTQGVEVSAGASSGSTVPVCLENGILLGMDPG